MQHQLCIVGGNGNMGKRYRSICEFLGIRHVSIDKGDDIPQVSHYLICTPTNNHMNSIRRIAEHSRYRSRIMCEKPIAIQDSQNAVKECAAIISKGVELFMVNNYAFYPGIKQSRTSITMYDYYNSGPHGLAWDCIQLLHLAKARVVLLNKSPIWKCIINGKPLDRERLDRCYVEMIQSFWKCEDERLWAIRDIRESHTKARDFDLTS